MLADTPGNGAVVVMSGTVRNQTDGKPVVALESSLRTDGTSGVPSISADIRTYWPNVTWW